MAIKMVNKQSAKPKTKKRKDGTTIPGRDYIRTADEGKIVPESFTAVVDNETLGAHFHDVDQFQIMLGVPDSYFQRKPVPELMIHYVDAFVTYGPITAGDSRFEYFTLRSHPSTGIWFMPQDREHLKYRGKRHFEVVPEPFELLAMGEIRQEVIIEDKSDGLQALLITAGPGATFIADPTDAPNGQYLVVVNGGLTHDGAPYEAESLGWQDSTDGKSEFVAQSDGCRAVIVRYPSPSTTERHIEELSAASVS